MYHKSPRVLTLQMEELQQAENRVKMCYAFMKSPYFYHQELAILNPQSSQLIPNIVRPANLYLYHYISGAGEALRSEEEIRSLVCTAATPIVCTGSHIPDLDRSIQLLSLPPGELVPGLEEADLLIVLILDSMSKEDGNEVLEYLRKAYYELDTCNKGEFV